MKKIIILASLLGLTIIGSAQKYIFQAGIGQSNLFSTQTVPEGSLRTDFSGGAAYWFGVGYSHPIIKNLEISSGLNLILSNYKFEYIIEEIEEHIDVRGFEIPLNFTVPNSYIPSVGLVYRRIQYSRKKGGMGWQNYEVNENLYCLRIEQKFVEWKGLWLGANATAAFNSLMGTNIYSENDFSTIGTINYHPYHILFVLRYSLLGNTGSTSAP